MATLSDYANQIGTANHQIALAAEALEKELKNQKEEITQLEATKELLDKTNEKLSKAQDDLKKAQEAKAVIDKKIEDLKKSLG
jgi:chromosome segregation ATPase